MLCVCVFILCVFVLSVAVSQRRCLFDVLCVSDQTQSQRCQCLGVQFGVVLKAWDMVLCCESIVYRVVLWCWCSGCVCCTSKDLSSHVVSQRTKRRLMSRHQKARVSCLSVPRSFVLSLSVSLPRFVSANTHTFTVTATHQMSHNMVVVVYFRFFLFLVPCCLLRASRSRGRQER